MKIIKRLIGAIPGGRALLERASYRRRSRKLRRIGGTEERFTHIFEHNKWKDSESRSGSGSSLAATEKLREALPGLFDAYDVSTILDAPCGDYNWFGHVERTQDIDYIGGDIVRALVDENQSRFGDERTSFRHLDVIRDPLPRVDLWLCRDCLIHLAFEDIERVVVNLHKSDIGYWLVTTHRRIERNIDIPTGHCRLINLELPPFGFPKPLRYVDDDDLENTGKSLGLWQKDQLSSLSIGRGTD